MQRNKAAIFATMGATAHGLGEREEMDYYATEPKALELILPHLRLQKQVWECACGEGHLAKVLERAGYAVRATDLIDRKYGRGGVDFLQETEMWQGDILTNPPYKQALAFAKKALELVEEGRQVVLFLKILFLEGKERKAFFAKNPPKEIWVSSSRLNCAKNGDFALYPSSAVCYAWYVWEKGWRGDTVIKWFN